MKTDNKIRSNSKRRHWRRTKLGLYGGNNGETVYAESWSSMSAIRWSSGLERWLSG
ncbi:hypothetical protein LEMLEM_LOCUS8295 [Lemmus lemmus]